MALDPSLAIREELIDVGTQKGGRYRKRITFFTFRCITCPNTFRTARYDLKKVSGRCRQCADKDTGRRSCGRSPKRPFEALYNRFVYDRRRFNQESDLTYEDFVAFTVVEECHYCGESIYWAPSSLERNGYKYNLDRKNNSLGYLKDNVVVCCWGCNETKSDRFT